MTTGADSWQVAGLWGDAAQCENAASGLTKKRQRKKLNLKKRCTFRGVSKFFFAITTETRQESIFLLKKKDTLHPTFSLVVSHPSSLLLSHCISLMC